MSDSRALWVLGVLNVLCLVCLVLSSWCFLVDLRAAEVCAIVIFMGVVGSDSIFSVEFSIVCFCFVFGYVCELFSELVSFWFGCYCSVVF